MNLISNKNTANHHQNMVDETTLAALSEVLRENLTDREEKFIRMQTGLYDGHKYTREEIAHEFNVTRERIIQLEKMAQMKLCTPLIMLVLEKLLKKIKFMMNESNFEH